MSRPLVAGMVPWLVAAGLILALSALVASGAVPAKLAGAAAPTAPVTGVRNGGGAADAAAQTQAALSRRQAELMAREDQLREQESKVARLVLDLTRGTDNASTLERLADTYAKLPPFKAAILLQALDPEMATEILRVIDQEQAAALLFHLDPATGADLTRRLMSQRGEGAR